MYVYTYAYIYVYIEAIAIAVAIAIAIAISIATAIAISIAIALAILWQAIAIAVAVAIAIAISIAIAIAIIVILVILVLHYATFSVCMRGWCLCTTSPCSIGCLYLLLQMYLEALPWARGTKNVPQVTLISMMALRVTTKALKALMMTATVHSLKFVMGFEVVSTLEGLPVRSCHTRSPR
jgi:hypothetical protein